MSVSDPQDPVITSSGSTTASRLKALVALVLLLLGATMLTVGVTLAFGLPWGLIVLGVMAVGLGVALGT